MTEYNKKMSGQFTSAPKPNTNAPTLRTEIGGYGLMDFNKLEADPVAGPILQRIALQVIRKDLRGFNAWCRTKGFTGVIYPDGSFELRSGESSGTKPSHDLSSTERSKVEQMTKAQLRELQ